MQIHLETLTKFSGDFLLCCSHTFNSWPFNSDSSLQLN